MSTTTFNDTWAPTWLVQPTVQGAKCCVVVNTEKFFKSGRRVVEAVFYDSERREVARRQGMRLTSKRGQEYVVCRREAEAEHRASGAGDLAEELLDE